MSAYHSEILAERNGTCRTSSASIATSGMVTTCRRKACFSILHHGRPPFLLWQSATTHHNLARLTDRTIDRSSLASRNSVLARFVIFVMLKRTQPEATRFHRVRPPACSAFVVRAFLLARLLSRSAGSGGECRELLLLLPNCVPKLVGYSATAGISFSSASHSSDCFCHASHMGPL